MEVSQDREAWCELEVACVDPQPPYYGRTTARERCTASAEICAHCFGNITLTHTSSSSTESRIQSCVPDGQFDIHLVVIISYEVHPL